MNISDILSENHILIDNNLSSKKGLLELASKVLASDSSNITPEEIFQAFLDRETLGSTGIGHKIAIPHARTDKIKHPQAVFIKLTKGVDFKSADNESVDLVLAFIVPKNDEKTHLKIIASIATLLEKESVREKIREIEDPKLLAQYLLNSEKTND